MLVVYADNLTGIDLRQIYDDHLTGDADLTLAAHREPFVMPFGELAADPDDPGRLVSYTEKPTYRPLVSSAVMVLGPRAVDRASAGGPMGISQLAQALVDDGRVVRLWLHDAPVGRCERPGGDRPGRAARGGTSGGVRPSPTAPTSSTEPIGSQPAVGS